VQATATDKQQLFYKQLISGQAHAGRRAIKIETNHRQLH